jgi:hypothetical protein
VGAPREHRRHAVEHFAARHLWDATLRTIPEFSFGVDVGERPITLGTEHSDVIWLEFDAALDHLEWESNPAALNRTSRPSPESLMKARSRCGMVNCDHSASGNERSACHHLRYNELLQLSRAALCRRRRSSFYEF